MKKRSWSLCGVPWLLLCLGFDCGYSDDYDDPYTEDAFVINQTDSPIDVVVRKPTVPCVEVSSDDIRDLTQSDFRAPETVSYGRRSLSVMPAGDNCHTEIFWLEIGAFSSIVRWSDLYRADVPDYITDESVPRAIFVEGRKGRLVVTVGSQLESFPAPREGAPALTSDTLDLSTRGYDDEYY